FRYKVIKTPGGTFDVARQAVDQMQVAQTSLTVPVEIHLYDPKSQDQPLKSGANSVLRGNLRLQGETTPVSISLTAEPKEFWFDRDAEVFGLVWDGKKNPKQALYLQGIEAAEAGKTAESEALFDQAYKTEDESPDVDLPFYYHDVQAMRRRQNALIDRARARLYLETGRDADAEKALDRSHKLAESGEWKLLKARLEIRRGDYDKAFRSLRKG